MLIFGYSPRKNVTCYGIMWLTDIVHNFKYYIRNIFNYKK